MINGKAVLAIIPARGGSKGLRGKNILEVCEKPLIAWTIEEAKKAKYIDRLIVSSEDEKIISVAKAWGCEVPFVRPAELAEDETPGIEPVLHAIEALPEKYDYVVLLQPTSPLRKVEDIDGGIEFCVAENAPACVSVTEPDKSPYWMYTIDNEGRLQPLMAKDKVITTFRQALPKVYALNGALYVGEVEWLLKNRSFLTGETIAFVMPKMRALDIDTEYDTMLLEFLIRKKGMDMK